MIPSSRHEVTFIPHYFANFDRNNPLHDKREDVEGKNRNDDDCTAQHLTVLWANYLCTICKLEQ